MSARDHRMRASSSTKVNPISSMAASPPSSRTLPTSSIGSSCSNFLSAIARLPLAFSLEIVAVHVAAHRFALVPRRESGQRRLPAALAIQAPVLRLGDLHERFFVRGVDAVGVVALPL